MAYSQPEISNSGLSTALNNGVNYVSYINHGYTRGSSVEHSCSFQHPNPDVTYITPTLSMPDLNHNHHYVMPGNGAPMQFETNGELFQAQPIVNENKTFLQHQGPYTPYLRASSSSTPDLALQTEVRTDVSNSPDLVSRKNLQLSQNLEHSVEDLRMIDSDTGNKDAIDAMTNAFMQEVMMSNSTEQTGPNQWLPNGIRPTPSFTNGPLPPPNHHQLQQNQLDVEIPGADTSVEEHTYENLPMLGGQIHTSLDTPVYQDPSLNRTSDIEQIGFDNPAYGMPALQTPTHAPSNSQTESLDSDNQINPQDDPLLASLTGQLPSVIQDNSILQNPTDTSILQNTSVVHDNSVSSQNIGVVEQNSMLYNSVHVRDSSDICQSLDVSIPLHSHSSSISSTGHSSSYLMPPDERVSIFFFQFIFEIINLPCYTFSKEIYLTTFYI